MDSNSNNVLKEEISYAVGSDIKKCLLSFVIKLKKKIGEKREVFANIPEHVYKNIAKDEFTEIFYEQVNDLDDFDKYLKEVFILKNIHQSKDRDLVFEIVEVKKVKL
jgi:hypothetical protein